MTTDNYIKSFKRLILIPLMFVTSMLSAQVNQDTTMSDSVEIEQEDTLVQQKAVFPGGEVALYKYISTKVAIDFCLIECTDGIAYVVTFVIEKDGTISNIEMLSKKYGNVQADYTTKSKYNKRERKERKKAGLDPKPVLRYKCSECCEKMEASVIEIFKNMPLWQPATQREKPVRMRFNIPVKIKIS